MNMSCKKEKKKNQKELNIKTDIGGDIKLDHYILQPYQLVKDLRSKIENTNPSKVLDGEIDEFIEEGLKK